MQLLVLPIRQPELMSPIFGNKQGSPTPAAMPTLTAELCGKMRKKEAKGDLKNFFGEDDWYSLRVKVLGNHQGPEAT